MDAREVRAHLEQCGDPNDAQIALLGELGDMYRGQGVLENDFAPALHACCPHRATCWQGNETRQPHAARVVGRGEDGSIFWPWVGPEYRRGGTALIALNIRHRDDEWFTLAEEFVIAEGVLGELAEGRLKFFGSSVPYLQLRAASAILDSRHGVTIDDRAGPARLKELLESCVRLQAVKCCPTGGRGAPTSEMSRTCPSFLLAAELQILAPSVVVTFGRDALLAVDGAMEFHWSVSNRGRPYQRGRSLDGLELFALPHPASPRWHAGFATFLDDLEHAPFRGAG